MEHRYLTLTIFAEAIKELPNPTAYYCTPRELILRCAYDWATIFQDLIALEEEEYVLMEQGENVRFAITNKGLDKARELQQSNQQKRHFVR